MSMTRKDFELIARIVRKHGGPSRDVLAASFAVELQSTNPNFDPDRFIAATKEARK